MRNFEEALEGAFSITEVIRDLRQRFPNARAVDLGMMGHLIVHHGYSNLQRDVTQCLEGMDQTRDVHRHIDHTNAGHKHS